MITHRHHLPTPHRLLTAERIGAIAWGAVLIWIGVALATSVGFGVTLIGLGLITLAVQGLRAAPRVTRGPGRPAPAPAPEARPGWRR